MSLLLDNGRNTVMYRMAYHCIELQHERHCNQCFNCPFNISLFLDDEREVMLIKNDAQMSFDKRSRRKMRFTVGNVFLLILVIFLIYGCCHYVNLGWASFTGWFDKPQQDTELAKIPQYIKYVHKTIRDCNGDGVVNCIDYAIRFYEVCPHAFIILNKNKVTNMNHLFNAVHVKSGWLFIDPGTVDPYYYTMKQVWGSMYNPYCNMDVTKYYSKWAK
jgi:hypothetical protein